MPLAPFSTSRSPGGMAPEEWVQTYITSRVYRVISVIVVGTFLVTAFFDPTLWWYFGLALAGAVVLNVLLTWEKGRASSYVVILGTSFFVMVRAYTTQIGATLDVLALIIVYAAIVTNLGLASVVFWTSLTFTIVTTVLGRFEFWGGRDPATGWYYANNVTLTIPLLILGYLVAFIVSRYFLRTIAVQETQYEQLRATRDGLVTREKLASVGELAAGVAHEINNPLMGIINYADLILEDVAGGKPFEPEGEDVEFLREIRREARRISRVTRNLLEFARSANTRPKPVDLARVLDRTISLVQHAYSRDGITLVRSFAAQGGPASAPSPAVIAEEGKLQQVFLSFLSNARFSLNRKYPGAAEEKRVEISLEPRDQPPEGPGEDEARGLARKASRGGSRGATDRGARPGVLVTFKDHGEGVPRGDLPRIFDPFFTRWRGNPQPGTGTPQGLGLAIANRLVYDMDGQILVDAREGAYFAISVWLPAAPPAGD